PVRTGTFALVESSDPQHISLTERADLMLVAPATSNILAKVAHGICDDLVSLMICAAACPVVFAPAMNNRMWDHPAARENVAKLTIFGYRFIGPEEGWLACRNVGAGRLSEPAKIVEEVTRMLTAPGALPAPVTGRAVGRVEIAADEEV
ncbi:MAG TPA: flavoprotein, partial [Tepidisphaeraceae bacterium]|nr:flavoprotein [Tepidisphaeraceae bacterium]